MVKKLDVLFVRAPQLIDEPASYSILPEGIKLVTILEENGLSSMYYSADFMGKYRSTIIDNIEKREEILKKETKSFLNLSHPKWRKMKYILKKYNPAIVVIYPHKSYNYTSSLLAAKLAKKVLNNVTTIIWNVLGIYDYFISPPYVDFVIKGNYGDTEYITLKLVKHIKGMKKTYELKKIPNLSFKNKGKIIHTNVRTLLEDLNKYPIPNRDLTIEKNYYPRFSFGWVEGGRGCKYKCNYCRASTYYFPPRLIDPKIIIEEIMNVYTKYHTREFYFYMPSFTLSHKWVKKVCNLIIRNKLDIIFSCYANPKEITKEIVKVMKRAGCIHIGIGVESGSEKVLKLMNRVISKDEVKRAAEIIKNEGIFLSTSTIIGYPFENLEDAISSFLFTLDLRADMMTFPFFIPHPELSLTTRLRDNKLIKDNNYYQYYSSEPKVKLNKKLLKYLKEKQMIFNKLAYKMNLLMIKKYFLNPKIMKNKLIEKFYDVILILDRG